MTNEEQKRIFANNLNRYMALNEKQQVDVAKDLNINPTTLNMWCKGNSIPSTGKIRKLADYFKIGMTDLTDLKDKSSENRKYSDAIANISLYDKRFQNIIVAYNEMPADKKELFCNFFERFIL